MEFLIRDNEMKLWYRSIMIKNSEILRKFESNFISDQGRLSYEQSRTIFTAMWKEGIILGVLPSVDPQAGVDVDIRIARILNACLTKS
jgi:hypothetical protein